MRRERIIAFCDGLIEAVVIIAMIAVFLVYGSMQDYLGGLLGAAALILLCSWYARFIATGTVYWVRNGLFVPAVVLSAVAATHIISVPPALLTFLNRYLLSLYADAFGGALPSAVPFALSAYSSLLELAFLLHLFVFLFVIVNVVIEKEFIYRCIGVMIGIIAVLSGLWIFHAVAPDLKEAIGNFLNCREDSTSLFFSRDHFLWALVVPYFFCAGLFAAHMRRRSGSLYGIVFILLTSAIVMCGDARISAAIVFGALCFAVLAILFSDLRRSIKIASMCAALVSGIVLASVAGFPKAGAGLAALQSSLWREGLVLREAGLLGLGAGGVPAAAAQAISQSSILSFGYRYGIVGVAGLLTLAAVYFTGSIRMIRKRNDRLVRMVSIGGVSGIAALCAGAFFGAPFESPAVSLNCFVSAGLVFVLLRLRSPENADDGDGDESSMLFDVKVMKIRSAKTALCAWLGFAAVVAVSVPVLRGSLAAYHCQKGMLKSPVEVYDRIEMPYDTILSYTGNQAYLKRKEAALLRAVELDPRNALYHETLGRLYSGDGVSLHEDSSERSRKSFVRARELEPLRAVRQEKEPAPAAVAPEVVRRVDVRQYKRDVSRILGSAAGNGGRLAQEMERCHAIVAADPAAADAVLATCVQATDDYDLLKAVVRDLPNGPETLALFLFSRNLWEKNDKKFNADLRRAPNEGKYPYYKALAEISLQSGNYKGAILLMEDCIRVCPNSAPACYWVAEKASYYPKQYSLIFVEEMHRKAIAADPQNIDYRIALYRHMFKSRKYQLAADELYRLSDEAPATPEVFYLLGRCYEELSMRSRAVEAYGKACAIDPAYKDARSRSEKLRNK